MKLEIKKERDTPLLSRKRVTLMAEYEGTTPSRIEIKKEVAKKTKADEKLVVIKHIYTRFGSNKAKIITHIYGNEEDMKKLENESLLVKHNPGAKKKKAEGEAQAEEKPAKGKAEEKPGEPEPKEDKTPKTEAKEDEKKQEAKAEGKPSEAKKEEAKPEGAPKEEKK